MATTIGLRCVYIYIMIICYSILTVTVSCCGITTHAVISHRAQESFNTVTSSLDYKKLISKHHDAFQAGSGFPDVFYPDLCVNGIYHDVSEDMHWTHFLNVSVNYIREHYPRPFDEATEKLVVFLFGIVSHQVADVLWHGLGVEQGFLVTMAKVNFHGSYTNAHQAGDFGGDIVSVFDMDVSPYMDPQREWYIPVDDLYRIYEEFYGTDKMSRDVICECSALFLLSGVAELIAGSEAYSEVAKTSPFLVDQLLDFFVGGVNDMAGWTNRIWNETITMLENGTSNCDIPHNPLFVKCNKTSDGREKMPSDQKRMKNGWFVEPNLRGFTRDDLEIKKAYRGVVIRPGHRIQKLIEQRRQEFLQRRKYLEKKAIYREKIKSNPSSHSIPQQRGIYYSPEPYSRLGWSLATGDLDGDGNDDLVTGAPGYSEPGSPQQGRIYIIYGDENGIPAAENPHDLINIDAVSKHISVIKGPTQVQSRFGSSVAVLDVNLDGTLDIAVGAPAYGNRLLDYNGAVFVYFGKPKSRIVQDSPNITITCQSKYCNLGMSLTVADFNKDKHEDLVLGLPFYQRPFNQSGVVSGLASDVSYKGQMHFYLESLIKSWNLQSKQSFSWFGYNLRARNGLLLVSQPFFRKCSKADCKISEDDLQTIGKLNLYNLAQTTPVPGLAVTGQKEFEMCGFSSDIGYPYDSKSMILAVGAPGEGHYGKASMLPMYLKQAGTVRLYNITGKQVKLVATFEGERQYGRFGAFVKFTDVNGDGLDDLLIGAPKHNADITDLLPRWLVNDSDGKLYTFYGGKEFPRGNATSSSNCGSYYPCPETVANFTAEAYGDRINLGWNAILTRSKNLNNLVVSALHGDELTSKYSSSTLYAYRINTTDTSNKAFFGKKH